MLARGRAGGARYLRLRLTGDVNFPSALTEGGGADPT